MNNHFKMAKHLPLKSPPKNICILRLSAIGDVTHVIPTIRAIQKYWPETEITWICGKLEYKLLHTLEDINFIVFDKKAKLSEYLKLNRQLKHICFDVLLHMQVSARANLASLAIKADIKLGWDRHRSRDLHTFFTTHSVKYVHQQHQTQGFLEFARALGLNIKEPVWNIPLTSQAKNFVNDNIDITTPYIVISASSSHQLRNWTSEAYAQVASYAIEKHGMNVVLSGGPSEMEHKLASDITKKISKKYNSNVINLVGKDTLEELIGILKFARFIISPDSGPAHLANAVGTDVIGLYACTWSKRSGPYNSLTNCVDKFEHASEKYLNKSASDLKWGTKIEKPGVMELIKVKDVYEKLDEVIINQTQSID